MGIILLERTDHRRQPVGGDAGIGGDGDAADEQAIDLRGQLKQTVLLPQKLPHRGQQELAVLREGYALCAAAKYRKTQFVFKGRHELIHTRGRVPQHLRRPGKAACFRCRQYRSAPRRFHTMPSSFAVS